jgi:hypothetical protein
MKCIIVISLLFLSYSCTMRMPDEGKKFEQITGDSAFIKNQALSFSKDFSEMLNLSPIVNGVDSFELRLWCSGIWTRKNLFILRYTAGNWEANNYHFYTNHSSLDSLFLTAKLIPGDTVHLITSFLDNIKTLPTQVAIPGFRDKTADGIAYTLEISTNNYYKYLSYRNPSRYNDDYHKTFTQLLDRLTKIFRLPLY